MSQSAEAKRAGKRVAIIQSNYIPWKGYFDIVNMVDEFILYDDRQYTRRDWRNRNVVKTSNGLRWLTIPVRVKGRFDQRIDETVIDDPSWAATHWRTIGQEYAGAAHFKAYRDRVGELYERATMERLSEVNRHFIEGICGIVGITTRLSWSTDYEPRGDKTERLVSLCTQAGATEYLSGPAARVYIDESQFNAAGITLRYMDYSGYPEYPQLHGAFEHGVTILDLIFNAGPDAPAYMKSFGAAVTHS